MHGYTQTTSCSKLSLHIVSEHSAADVMHLFVSGGCTTTSSVRCSHLHPQGNTMKELPANDKTQRVTQPPQARLFHVAAHPTITQPTCTCTTKSHDYILITSLFVKRIMLSKQPKEIINTFHVEHLWPDLITPTSSTVSARAPRTLQMETQHGPGLQLLDNEKEAMKRQTEKFGSYLSTAMGHWEETNDHHWT